VGSAASGPTVLGALLAPRSWQQAYAIAVVLTLVAALLRWMLAGAVGDAAPFALFFPAVMVAALTGGTGPGLVALVLSAAVTQVPGLGSDGRSLAGLTGAPAAATLLLFVVPAALLVALGSALRTLALSRHEMATLFDAVQELALDGVVIFRVVRGEDGRIVDFERIYMNAAAERVLGSSKLLVGRRYLESSPTAQRDRLFARYIDVMATGIPAEDEFRFESGGRWIYNVAARIDRDRLAITFRDITNLRETIDQQKFLMRELNHRVKNVLTSVLSLARQTAADQGLAAYREALTARISAMARAHDLLMTESWESARLADIVAQTLAPYDRIFARGPTVAVTADLALNINMVLHELATNATKYGALSDPEGHVDIRWELAEDGRASLTWQECGGPPVSPPTRRGFGSRILMRGFNTDTRRADLSFPPSGVNCTLCFEVRGADEDVGTPSSPRVTRAG